MTMKKKTAAKPPEKSPAKPTTKKPRGAAAKPGPAKPARPAGPKTRAAAPRPSREPMSNLEIELAQLRERFKLLLEDRDNQVALAEAADTEREILQGQLEEALARVRSLEARLEAAPASSPQSQVSRTDEEIPYGEEEEEVAPPEEMDDVETLYSRMDDSRVRRGELDRERIERESEMSDESWWMVCPKCGDSLDEVEGEDVKLERCENCGGIYLDRGEVELLVLLAEGRHGLQRIRNILSI